MLNRRKIGMITLAAFILCGFFFACLPETKAQLIDENLQGKATVPAEGDSSDYFEQQMPPKVGDEINVVIRGKPKEPNRADGFAYAYFGQLKNIDYILEITNAWQFYPTLKAITKNGRKIKTLVIYGHGDPAHPGVQITDPNDVFGDEQFDYMRIANEARSAMRNREDAKKALAEAQNLPPSAERYDEEKRAMAWLDGSRNKLKVCYELLNDMDGISGIMADGGLIIMMNCFSGKDERHRNFSQKLGRLFFGNNGGKLIASTHEQNPKYSYRTSRYYINAEGFLWGEWITFQFNAGEAERPRMEFLEMEFKEPYIKIAEGDDVEITAPQVAAQADSGKLNYMWGGECAGTEGPRCVVETKGRDGQILEVKSIVSDERGRYGEDAVFILVKERPEEEKISAEIKVSGEAPAAGSTVGANVLITKGKRPRDTYWEWKATGGLSTQQRYGDSIKIDVQGKGELKARLVSDNALIGRGQVLAEASAVIIPKSRVLPAPPAGEPKKEEEKRPEGEKVEREGSAMEKVGEKPELKEPLPPASEPQSDIKSAMLKEINAYINQFDGTCFGKYISVGDPELFRAGANNGLRLIVGEEGAKLIKARKESRAYHYTWDYMRWITAADIVFPFDPRNLSKDPNKRFEQRQTMFHEMTHHLEWLSGVKIKEKPRSDRNCDYQDQVVNRLHKWADTEKLILSKKATPESQFIMWQDLWRTLRELEAGDAAGGILPDDNLRQINGFHARFDDIRKAYLGGKCGEELKKLASLPANFEPAEAGKEKAEKEKLEKEREERERREREKADRERRAREEAEREEYEREKAQEKMELEKRAKEQSVPAPQPVPAAAIPQPAGGMIEPSADELEGMWVLLYDLPYINADIRVSRSGNSYTGTVAAVSNQFGRPLEGVQGEFYSVGKVVVRVTLVGPNAYQGEVSGIGEHGIVWQKHNFAIKDGVFYATDVAKREGFDPNILGWKKKEKKSEAAAPEAVKIRVEKISPASDTIVVGGKAQFKATVTSGSGQGLNFQWQPHPEVEFAPFEKSSTTTATFRRPGTYKIYVQALKKEGPRYVTVGESNQLEVTVTNPAWKLSFDLQKPLIGEELKARIGLDMSKGVPSIDMKEMNFRWQLPQNARQTMTSADDREITFYLTNDKPAKISCLASTKYNNDNLGGAGKTISAKAYDLTIIGPKPRQELQEWKGDTQLGRGQSAGMKKVEKPFVVGQEILFSSKIDPVPPKPVSYNWTASPEGCTFNSNGGNSTSITCSSPGGYTMNVTAKMDGMEIGSATASVSVAAQPGGVTGADKAKEAAEAKKAAEEKKAAEAKKEKEEKAQRLINEGYAKERQGNIKEALDKYRAAREIVPDAGVADRIRGLEQKEKQAQQAVNEGYSLEKQGRLAEAVEKYKSAVKLSPDSKLTEHVAVVEKKIAPQREKAEQTKAIRSPAPRTMPEKDNQASFSGELEGAWIGESGTTFSQEEMRFSRNGNFYSGLLTSWNAGDHKSGYYHAGDEVFRMLRVSAHVYHGERRKAFKETSWATCRLGVYGDVLYIGGDISEIKPDSGSVFAHRK